jgi:hypothetical protein
LASSRKTDGLTSAATRVVGVPSRETEATVNSTEGPTFTPHGPDVHGANDSPTTPHQKRPLLTNTRWVGATAALVIVSSFTLSLIIRSLGKRTFELPSISWIEAAQPEAARVSEVARSLTDKQYSTPPLERQQTRGAQDPRGPFKPPQHNQRGVSRTHQTTTASSALETVVGENPGLGAAVDVSSEHLSSTGKITNIEDDVTSVFESLMSKGTSADEQGPNSTIRQTTTESNPSEAVVEQDSAPGTAIDKSSGQLPDVEAESAMSSARALDASSRAGNSTSQTKPESNETVVGENPAPGDSGRQIIWKTPKR